MIMMVIMVLLAMTIMLMITGDGDDDEGVKYVVVDSVTFFGRAYSLP